jgi:hypothetical protein
MKANANFSIRSPMLRSDMHVLCHTSASSAPKLLPTAALSFVLLAAGCANPGPPRPPSLWLPQPVHDLVAERIGGHVELRFTAPSRTTDKLPLRDKFITGVVCRGVERQECAVSGAKRNLPKYVSSSPHELTVWQDALPSDLATGLPRVLVYRVEFLNANGKSAGKSDAAYTVAGSAPLRVESLQAAGSRLGVVLNWAPAPSDEDAAVVIQREDLRTPDAATKKEAKDKTVWLAANASGKATSTLDVSAEPNVPYRYTAVRRRMVRLGGRSIELRSEASLALDYTLREAYPPPVPTDVTAAGFSEAAKFSVDLIWQPVDEAGLITKLAGYNVYREQMGAAGKPVRLNTSPVPQPSFRDESASASVRYRYSVSAVDIKGNESKTAFVVLEPSAQ